MHDVLEKKYQTATSQCKHETLTQCCFNAGHRLKRWSNIIPTLGRCLVIDVLGRGDCITYLIRQQCTQAFTGDITHGLPRNSVRKARFTRQGIYLLQVSTLIMCNTQQTQNICITFI